VAALCNIVPSVTEVLIATVMATVPDAPTGSAPKFHIFEEFQGAACPLKW